MNMLKGWNECSRETARGDEQGCDGLPPGEIAVRVEELMKTEASLHMLIDALQARLASVLPTSPVAEQRIGREAGSVSPLGMELAALEAKFSEHCHTLRSLLERLAL